MPNIRDFYMRDENDPKYRPDQIEVYDELEASITQVRMTALTRRGEVLGEPDFGEELEKYLFEFDVDPFMLSNSMQLKIDKYVTESKKRKIVTRPSYTVDEKGRKIYALQISIDGLRSPFAILYE